MDVKSVTEQIAVASWVISVVEKIADCTLSRHLIAIETADIDKPLAEYPVTGQK